MNAEFVYVGELPPGDWRFCLVSIKGSADAIVIADKEGKYRPRMLIDGKLIVLRAA